MDVGAGDPLMEYFATNSWNFGRPTHGVIGDAVRRFINVLKKKRPGRGWASFLMKLLLPSVSYKTNPWLVYFAEKSSASVASAILADAGS